jgi:hypothetical protein
MEDKKNFRLFIVYMGDFTMKITKSQLKQIIQEELGKIAEVDMEDDTGIDYEGNGVRAIISDYGKTDDKKYSVTIEIVDPNNYIDEETFGEDLEELLLPYLIDNFASAHIKV